MFVTMRVHAKFLSATVLHNGQLADSACIYVIRRKEIEAETKRKIRTETQVQEYENLEWEGSLYLDHDGHPCWPGTVIEGAYFEAGKKLSKGSIVRGGLMSQGDWKLIYDGPKDIKKLMADPRFRWRTMVKNPSTKGRIARVRPRFLPCELKYEVMFNDELLSRSDIVTMTEILASRVGLSDDRTKMGGRFEIISIDGNKDWKADARGTRK